MLPLRVGHVASAPVKCQGIKTKLVPFILGSIAWDEGRAGRWIEPFCGSCVVALNLAPQRALLADTNRHIIDLYKGIQTGVIAPASVRAHLAEEGKWLVREGAAHYNRVRERFNESGEPLDFLFLNRSCFNGLIRFNKDGAFNVPFGHKPLRFSSAYVSKVANQVAWAVGRIAGRDWEFVVADWQDSLRRATSDDFVYADPPYVGRHADYFNGWTNEDALRLAHAVGELPCGYAVSMWLENRYRRNDHVDRDWPDSEVREWRHHYFVGATEALRNDMTEALIIRRGYAAAPDNLAERARERPLRGEQLRLSLAPGPDQ